MTPSWLNNYLGVQPIYGANQAPNASNWLQESIPSKIPIPYGQTQIDWSGVPQKSQLSNRMPMMMASQMISAGQEKSTPMAQNNIPMGRNMSYQDIMKMYGIQGLMG